MCGNAISPSSNLTVHMRTHTGDRPYACTTCGQALVEQRTATRCTLSSMSADASACVASATRCCFRQGVHA